MKTYLNAIAVLVILLPGIFLISCNNSKDPQPASPGAVRLGLSVNENSGRITEDPVPTGIVVTIKDSNGVLIYNLESFNVVEVNGSYVSSIIELDAGSYTVEDFIVTDATNASIYITPKSGSEYEELVSTPLPISFEISSEETTTLNLDVISTELGQASDFGYVEFSFNVVDLQSGLVAYYPFNGNTNDESGNGHNASAIGSHNFDNDYIGSTIEIIGNSSTFSSTGGHVELPDFQLDTMNEFSISMWVKEIELLRPHGETYIFFGQDVYSGHPEPQSVAIRHTNPSNEIIQWNVGPSTSLGGGIINYGTNNINVAAFNHYTLLFDGTFLKAYLNGQYISQDSALLNNMGSFAALGSHYWTSQSTGIHAEFDELRIYKRALKPSEIKMLSEQ